MQLKRSPVQILTLICSLISYGAQAQTLPGLPLGDQDPKIEATWTEIPLSIGEETTISGPKVLLSVRVILPLGRYTYGINSPATKIEFSDVPGLTPEAGFTTKQKPKLETQLTGETVEKFFDEVTWTRVYVADGEIPQDLEFQGKIRLGVCNEQNCRDFRKELIAARAEATDSEEPPSTPAPDDDIERLVSEVEPTKGKNKVAKWKFILEPAEKPGEVWLIAECTLPKHWHIFPLELTPPTVGIPTEFEISLHEGLVPQEESFHADQETVTSNDGTLGPQTFHKGKVVWRRLFKLVEGASLESAAISGNVTYQTCRDGKCINWNNIAFQVGRLPPPMPVESPNALAPNQLRGGNPVQLGSSESQKDDLRKNGLIPYILFAFVAGLGALLTPCVFPMMPITVSVFLKQSEQKHHSPIRMAIVYCLGIIGTFTILGLVMSVLFEASSLTTLANDPYLNLFLSAMLLFFALNLLGMYDITLPSWLVSAVSNKESVGGYVGVLFTALTFTLTSFTCTFGFVGLVLVWASQGEFFWPTIGLLSFSSGFALPFFFLALFPSMLKKLPRSGGWLNSIKVVMGLIEIAFVFKFLSVADISWFGEPWLFDRQLVLSAWMALSLAAGMYLLGVYRFHHDSPSNSIGVMPAMVGLSFIGFGAYLSVGLYGNSSPHGLLWQKIAAFAPPELQAGHDVDKGPFLIGEHDDLEYLLDHEKAVLLAQKQNLPLFLDFTGVNCLNCREMELLFAKPENKALLQKFVRVQLYQDLVPISAAPESAERLLKLNHQLADEFVAHGLPEYRIVTPEGEVLASSEMANENGEFAKFLQTGLDAWNARHSKSEVVVQSK